ncbi:MAG: hypothetical protein ACLPKB_27785 [Xanthobacteraceae bacterium]
MTDHPRRCPCGGDHAADDHNPYTSPPPLRLPPPTAGEIATAVIDRLALVACLFAVLYWLGSLL